MSFNNPIVGKEVLVRTAIQSEGFSIDPENQISGWRLERDGSAFLTNVSVGNTNYQIDENGNGSFNDVTVNGELYYSGTPLWLLFEAFPKGIQYWGALNTISGNTTTGTEVALLELDTELISGRMYRLVCSEAAFTANPITTAPMIGTLRMRDGGASSPTTSSNLLQRASIEIPGFTGAAGHSKGFEFVFACDDSQTPSASVLNSGTHRFILTMSLSSGAGTLAITTGSGTNNPITLYLEDMGPLVQNTGQALTGAGGGTTPVKTYTKTYSATWSRAWDSSLNPVSTNGELRQGYYSSSNGNQRSWVGFDFNQIQSDLSGATVIKVEFYLYYDFWYFNDGGTAVIGTISSTATSAPSYDGTKDNQDRKRVSFTINQGKWIDMTSVVGSEFKTGASTGICIGIGPSTSHEYYGKARGNTETNEPQIRITYKK